jgi:cytochrome c biogenesis protein CcmG/thiol:disulfide interchange protein DsbE
MLFLLVVALVGQPHPIGKGVPAPAVRAVDLAGNAVDVTMYAKGQPLVVNIWGTWCPPCLHELPGFVEEAVRLKGRVQFIGLAVDSPPEEIAEVVRRLGIPYPIARIDGETTRRWHADALPSTYLIDNRGVIQWSVRGAVSQGDLRDALRDALGIDAAP